MAEKIKLTREFKEAFNTMDAGSENLFITGRAGTGKSTLLQYFRAHTKKKLIVLAPTGVAALNVKGQTIHSFFGFHPAVRIELVRKAPPDSLPLFEAIETIVIDEISMVRADLLDCIDRALRLNRGRPNEPFGGVHMIFIGDLFQLPPIVTDDEKARFTEEYSSPYFFSAGVMQFEPLKIIELKTVHRQKEKDFIELLEKVRTRTLTQNDIEAWNEHHDPYFDPREEKGYVHLTTTNKMAQQRNEYELKQLSGKIWKLKAQASGNIPDRRMPSEDIIGIKTGARIMFTTNDSEKRWVNGTLGTVIDIKNAGLSKIPTLTVELEDGKKVKVQQYTWELFEYIRNAKGYLEESVIGSYTQYPITLAWAVTIHKAQGKTFDRVLVDMGWGAFAHGQLYVALSRCTTRRGLVLLKPFRAQDVILDSAVLAFFKDQASQAPKSKKS